MANITKFNTRVQLKFDTWANWNSTTGAALVPLKGEICICEIPADTAATGEVLSEKAYLLKVGDGTTAFGSLPWLSAPAADVHSWAKKSETDFKDWLISDKGPDLATQSQIDRLSTTIDELDFDDPTASGTATSVITNVSQTDGKISATKKNLPSVSDPEASGESITFIDTIEQTNGAIVPTKKTVRYASSTEAGIVTLGASGGAATYARAEQLASEISTIQSKISNAMHFLGITTTSLSDGATTATITIKNGDATSEVTLTAADAGAVVLTATPSSSGIQYEYVWTGSVWGQLGQEGSFAVKGSIENSDISSNAAIASTKIASSLGGTNLSTDIAGLDDRLTSAESDISSLQTGLAKTWKTDTLIVASTAAEVTAASTLSIADTDIDYIIFDCGSSTVNI